MVISAPGVSQEALNVTDSAKSAAAASSSNYPNIFRLFESDSAPHLAPQRWSKRMKLKLRVTRKEWWASLAASSEERRPLAHRQAWCQTRGTGYTPRIQRERQDTNWAEHQSEMWQLRGVLVSDMDKLWQSGAICSKNGDRGGDSVLDLRSTKVGVWHQQEHNMPRGECLTA